MAGPSLSKAVRARGPPSRSACRGAKPKRRHKGKMFPVNHQKKVVLIAEDDEDHFLLAKDAFVEAAVPVELRWVKDGEELMEYLSGIGDYSAEGAAPRPKLILLDLNMPRKDGRE